MSVYKMLGCQKMAQCPNHIFGVVSGPAATLKIGMCILVI